MRVIDDGSIHSASALAARALAASQNDHLSLFAYRGPVAAGVQRPPDQLGRTSHRVLNEDQRGPDGRTKAIRSIEYLGLEGPEPDVPAKLNVAQKTALEAHCRPCSVGALPDQSLGALSPAGEQPGTTPVRVRKRLNRGQSQSFDRSVAQPSNKNPKAIPNRSIINNIRSPTSHRLIPSKTNPAAIAKYHQANRRVRVTFSMFIFTLDAISSCRNRRVL